MVATFKRLFRLKSFGFAPSPRFVWVVWGFIKELLIDFGTRTIWASRCSVLVFLYWVPLWCLSCRRRVSGLVWDVKRGETWWCREWFDGPSVFGGGTKNGWMDANAMFSRMIYAVVVRCDVKFSSSWRIEVTQIWISEWYYCEWDPVAGIGIVAFEQRALTYHGPESWSHRFRSFLNDQQSATGLLLKWAV